jgi:hypothetical protein
MKKMIVLILIIQSVVFWHLSGMLNEVRQTTHSEASVDAIRWKVSFEVNDEVKELLRQARASKVRT